MDCFVAAMFSNSHVHLKQVIICNRSDTHIVLVMVLNVNDLYVMFMSAEFNVSRNCVPN